VIELKTKVKRLGAFACFVFLISIFFPFLQAVWQGGGIPEIRSGTENFWSFRITYEITYSGRGLAVDEYWYFDYWFLMTPHFEVLERWAGPVLILTLASQILVLLFSALAILLDKGQLFLFSISLNAVALFCMSLLTYTLHHDYERYPAVGFWLTLLAAVLFVVAFFTTSGRWER